MLKVAALMPMPRPSVSTAAAVKPGARRIMRNPYIRSCMNVCMMRSPWHGSRAAGLAPAL